MPILLVKVSGKKSAETTHAVSELLFDITTRILKKRRDVMSVVIDYVDHDAWIIAGKTLSEHGKNSFYFDIKVTDEINTKDQKSEYIKAAFEGFEKILGNLHPQSYVYVEDVRGGGYGFGGITTEYRYYYPESTPLPK